MKICRENSSSVESEKIYQSLSSGRQ